MKPRIRLINCIWHCAVPFKGVRPAGWACGIGFSPKEAFKDWKGLQK